MPHYEYTVSVLATPDVLWQVVTDVVRWPMLTPSMTQVTLLPPRQFVVGAQADIKQPGLPLTRWTIRSLQAPLSFVWDARVLGVTMVASHRIVPQHDATVQLQLAIQQTGLLATPLWWLSHRQVQTFIQQEAHGLAYAAEVLMGETRG